MPRYDDLYEAAGRQHNVDPALIKAIAIQESGEDPTRTGTSGEWGMMQFMPATAKQYGLTREQAYNSPRDAIFAAAHYMSDNLDRYTDRSGRVNLAAAVAAYNGSGPAAQNYAATVIPIYRKVAATGRPPSNDAIIGDAVARARGDQAGHGGTSADPDVAAGMDALNAAAGGKPASSARSDGTQHDTAADDDVKAGMAVLDAARKTEPPKKEPAAGHAFSTTVDPYGSPWVSEEPPPAPNSPAMDRILGAGVEGWRRGSGAGVPDLAPETTETLRRIGIYPPAPGQGTWLQRQYEEIGNALGAGYRTLGGVLGAGQAAVAEATPDVHLPALPQDARIPLPGGRFLSGELTPGSLGREIAALPEAFPFGHSPGIPEVRPPGGAVSRSITVPDREAPGGQRTVTVAPNALARESYGPPLPHEPLYLGQEFRADPALAPREASPNPNPLAPSATGPSQPNPSVPPEAPTPVPAPPAGRGGAAGADVTTSPIPPKTPVERVRDLEKAVLQTAEERAGPQLVDNAPYVPGIPARLLPSRDFSKSVNALDAKVASARDPAFRDAVDANARVRNEGMVDHLREGAGDLTALEQAHEARSAVSPSAMRVFEGEKPVDAADLLAKIDETLNGPEGKQKAVRTTLSDVRASLFDGEGNLETMPSRLYGARRNLTDLLKKGVKGTGDLADDVRASKHILNGLLEDFDPLITDGAPRFTEYLKAWSEASKPIDQMEFLQNYFSGSKKITNDAGYLQPGKVQKMFDDVLQGHKARGVNKAKSLTDEQIARIEAVRNELQADQLRDRLASVRGSDTFQQFNSRMFGEGPVVNALRHGRDIALGAATGGIYNLGVKPIMETNRLRRIERKTEARKRQLLEEGPNALGPD